MRRSSWSGVDCSIAQTLDVVGDPWTLLIIRDAFFGLRRFEATTFIWPPQGAHVRGSIAYTRLMSMAQVWLARLRAGTGPASPLDDAAAGSNAAAASAALRRIPRALFEYQP
jgi:hypothetical protein